MASISNASDTVLKSRIEDTVRLCEKRGAPCFLGFLDEREQALTASWLRKCCPQGSWSLFGGHEEAERQILGVIPSYFEQADVSFPLVTVAFCYHGKKMLTHRDVLGTLLSLGIRRDTVGDILCDQGLVVVFLRQEIADFVCEQVKKIGGQGVTAHRDYDGVLPTLHRYTDISATIASRRLDVVVKALLGCSREDATQLIRTALVMVNHQIVQEVSDTVSAGCTLSIRGKGRYVIDQIGPKTKKGRLVLIAKKCI
ncbi:MAG: hypothetical protein II363_05650 [Clostridia bacterium]|nr:hypothetical protein [Clostridia bacterium]